MPINRILMCPPDHFNVDYAINPWMEGNEDEVDTPLAMRQWKNLKAAIEQAGAEVAVIPAQPGLPDMVFTANAATVYRNKAVPARFYHAERNGEEPHFIEWLSGQGFEIHELPEDIIYEGAGDSLFDRESGVLWAGHNIRSDLRAHRYLAEWFGVEVLPLKLETEHYYHIDTCFCPLTGGYLLYYPEAFDAQTNQLIESRVPAGKRIAVSDDEAEAFACNAVNVGQTVIMNACSERLRKALEGNGFRVVECPVGEFLKSGGSTKCLTLKLVEPEG